MIRRRPVSSSGQRELMDSRRRIRLGRTRQGSDHPTGLLTITYGIESRSEGGQTIHKQENSSTGYRTEDVVCRSGRVDNLDIEGGSSRGTTAESSSHWAHRNGCAPVSGRTGAKSHLCFVGGVE